MASQVIALPIEEEMKSSYLDYAMSVIIGRAIPDVRDGLKPVQRRILYAMYDIGNRADKPYKKSARIVGEVLGKYHPHGDAAIYDALVRMAQDFSLRYPLVDGQGNFGSIDGDSAAAMRYTEVRMAPIAEELLRDIEKETVDFVPNFDGTLKEPVVLPSRIPNLLINGSSGIAVGMATNIPPHNLAEVVDALVALIEGKSEEEALRCIKGPDFPTGGIVIAEGLYKAYSTGKGKFRVRAKMELDEKNGVIRVKEIPYQTSKSAIIEQIAQLVKNKKIEEIVAIQDRSDKEGLEIYIKAKQGTDLVWLAEKLYALTNLEISFNMINLAIVDGVPKVLSLAGILKAFIDFRKTIVRRRTQYELRIAEEQAHVLQGLLKALEQIERVIETIKTSKTVEEANKNLQQLLAITEKQAKAILEMRLQRLTSLERQKLEKKLNELLEKIKEYKAILSSEQRLLEVIKKELLEIKQKYGDRRKTEILSAQELILPEEKVEEYIVILTRNNYIKRVKLQEYRLQKRGGVGLKGAALGESDDVRSLLKAKTNGEVLVFTNKGRVFALPLSAIPEGSRYSKGRHLRNLVQLDEEEHAVSLTRLEENAHLLFFTKQGVVKKTPVHEFKRLGKAGVRAIGLGERDVLVKVVSIKHESNVVICTKKGKALMFSSGEIRAMGRGAIGVRGIALQKDDEVIGGAVAKGELITLSAKGFGKRTPIEEFRCQHRGGQGVVAMRLTEKTGEMVWAGCGNEHDELIISTNTGRMIRIPVKEVKRTQRSASGVKVIKLHSDERISACTLITEGEEDEA